MEVHRQTALGTEPKTGTIGALLDVGQATNVALAGVNRPPLTYSALRSHVQQTVASLNVRGIGRNDRVAIVLPNGPELASAFVGIAAGATAAPLNAAYRDFDFRFYLSDLGAKALVVQRNCESPAVAVAKALRIPVLQLVWNQEDPAGVFSVVGDPVGPAKTDGFAGTDDTALVLHTSGTTSRPKMVPLSQSNLTASARHIIGTLKLSPDDRCLNVMPLIHIHGLVAGVLSSLAAGASVFCAPGLNALEFFNWMAEAKPTWYTAVPTMHQAVLAYADQHREIFDRVHLRFIRSSSATLPPAVMRKLEQAFNAPVIDSYGMTEAAHQMASNPLPPAVRKPGTVGLAAGPEIAIMGPRHELLPAGVTGEVVIRGPNVTDGYENNPEANAVAFTNGWFHTGDQGVMDADGYLTITGRLKEIINRGGEKISPKEVDDALMDHPDIVSAATFPIPHPTLGEEIGSALVVKRGAVLNEQALARFLSSRLATFKIPRRFVFVGDIPKGPTGKIQRHNLAAALGLNEVAVTRPDARHMDERPATPLEAKLKSMWEKVLGLDGIGLNENFFLLGGDSLQAVELLMVIEEALGHRLPQSVLIESGTVAEMAARIEGDSRPNCVVPFHPVVNRPPFFCVHDVSGQVLNLHNLAHHLGNDQPFYGIQCVGADGKGTPLTRIEDMAAHYVREIRQNQPVGPYYLGGFSMGGWVAYEMTRQLQAEGEKVALLVLIDAYFGPVPRRATLKQWLGRRLAEFYQLRIAEVGEFLAKRLRNVPGMVVQTLWRRSDTEKRRPVGGKELTNELRWQQSLEEINATAVRSYRLQPVTCDAVVFKTNIAGWDNPDLHEGWKAMILGNVEMRAIDGRHFEVVNEPFVRKLAAGLTECLREKQSRNPV